MSTPSAPDTEQAYRHLRVEQQGSALLVTIDRPQALNALATELVDELQHVVAQAAAALADGWPFRGLVLTGAGGKAFVAGADIREMSAMSPDEAQAYSQRMHRLTLDLERLPVPVVAAVDGYALGGGCELALACDVVFASETARFGQPEVSLGLVPGFGGSVRLQQRVGPGMARELIFTGRQIDSAEALRIGLVNRVLPDRESLLAAARETVELIARQAPTAVGNAKLTLGAVAALPTEDGLAVEAASFRDAFTTDDSRAGRAAFLAKETPSFPGR
ncbi:enoyl-CoA hydratase-related protein [Zhihengliuella alba]|uniref:Enoyl-CoA hydratase-related protein n=1 Tax=Zhihengliuella alba TaxID=547018 RepID=A0ABP7DKF4_9MICC